MEHHIYIAESFCQAQLQLQLQLQLRAEIALLSLLPVRLPSAVRRLSVDGKVHQRSALASMTATSYSTSITT